MTLSQNMTLTFDVDQISLWWGGPILASPAPAQMPTAVHATETDMVELGLAIHAAGVFPGLTQEVRSRREYRIDWA